jgi:hypothetical protein
MAILKNAAFFEFRSRDATELDKLGAEVDRFLRAYKREAWTAPVVHIVRELVFNSLKANIKRLFLEERGRVELEDLLPAFREALETHPDDLLQALGSSKFYVEVELSPGSAGFVVTVRNNAEMLAAERSIVDRILSGKETYADPSDALDQLREGGGLGLRMIRRMLDSAGLGPAALTYSSGSGITEFRLAVPGENT